MAKVTGGLVIQRPLDVVSDVVADQRNEPRYNPALLSAEMVTDEPAWSTMDARFCRGE